MIIKKLPITKQKDMNTYLWYAYRFCIIDINKYIYEQWYNMHFINLIAYSYKDSFSLKLDYEEYIAENECFNDVFYFENITFEKMLSLDVDKTIIECIMNEKYIELEIDEYYLPSSRVYNKKHFVHPIIIYGYNSNGIVYYMGVGNRYIDQYEEKISVISNSLKQAVLLNVVHPIKTVSSCCRIISSKTEISDKYNVEEIKKSLECLMYSTHNSGITDSKSEIFAYNNILYGYEAIETIIRCLLRGYNNDYDIDYRVFHLLSERADSLKCKLLYAFQTVGKHFTYYIDYCKLNDQYETLRLICLKDLVRNRDFLKCQIKRDFYSKRLSQILSLEKKLVSNVLEVL